ncbi:RNA polymerase, sigma subunit, ECF family [Actinacidiphila yanglinensis]|uniref:RNA polymerase, sigma subunit, ECF family n=1 Tax=Actinacidiphila yanglinensis TaxID=310779 RepID=A0A1H6AJH3_9ACTN|nr:sigma-70 family RNA polymerase sigma factor [Actinacidiphila yanglinensis]SEG48858.1 RNA polymerase, sigma subunit, ECF family [Actinacidiphila yanglinensis]
MSTDEEALSRARHDPAAFEPLVDRHSAALHAYLFRRCGPVADDLLSEVWLTAYARRADFRVVETGTVRGWLFGIARNHALAHWRRNASAPTPGSPAPGGDDTWDAVDARLDAARLRPALRAALRELPPVEREVLVLTAWEQLTPAEAAQTVGIGAATARSRLHRARARMRDLMADHPADRRAGPPPPLVLKGAQT